MVVTDLPPISGRGRNFVYVRLPKNNNYDFDQLGPVATKDMQTPPPQKWPSLRKKNHKNHIKFLVYWRPKGPKTCAEN